jgi:hypothetical protein
MEARGQHRPEEGSAQCRIEKRGRSAARMKIEAGDGGQKAERSCGHPTRRDTDKGCHRRQGQAMPGKGSYHDRPLLSDKGCQGGIRSSSSTSI